MVHSSPKNAKCRVHQSQVFYLNTTHLSHLAVSIHLLKLLRFCSGVPWVSGVRGKKWNWRPFSKFFPKLFQNGRPKTNWGHFQILPKNFPKWYTQNKLRSLSEVKKAKKKKKKEKKSPRFLFIWFLYIYKHLHTHIMNYFELL